jgi:hypothetical protein
MTKIHEVSTDESDAFGIIATDPGGRWIGQAFTDRNQWNVKAVQRL